MPVRLFQVCRGLESSKSNSSSSSSQVCADGGCLEGTGVAAFRRCDDRALPPSPFVMSRTRQNALTVSGFTFSCRSVSSQAAIFRYGQRRSRIFVMAIRWRSSLLTRPGTCSSKSRLASSSCCLSVGAESCIAMQFAVCGDTSQNSFQYRQVSVAEIDRRLPRVTSRHRRRHGTRFVRSPAMPVDHPSRRRHECDNCFVRTPLGVRHRSVKTTASCPATTSDSGTRPNREADRVLCLPTTQTSSNYT